MVRYYGALAPNAKIREQVVKLAGPSEALRLRLQQAAVDMGLEPESEMPAAKENAESKKLAPHTARHKSPYSGAVDWQT